MKFNPAVSSSRRKNRKRHFDAPSHVRRKLMSAPLSKELRKKFDIKSMPVVKGDTVQVARGKFKKWAGKVTQVYRKKFVIYIETVKREKTNGDSKFVGIHPSKVQITHLNMNNKGRQAIVENRIQLRKAAKGEKFKCNPDAEIVEAPLEVMMAD